jgi:hypothetical protein
LTVPHDRRKYPRLSQSFQTKTRILPSSEQLSGITHNLSQSGAFIINPSWSDFQANDQMEILFYLPPEFTGQKDTLVLRGLGTVRRVDGDRWGIAVEFAKEFRTFEVSRGEESHARTP